MAIKKFEICQSVGAPLGRKSGLLISICICFGKTTCQKSFLRTSALYTFHLDNLATFSHALSPFLSDLDFVPHFEVEV